MPLTIDESTPLPEHITLEYASELPLLLPNRDLTYDEIIAVKVLGWKHTTVQAEYDARSEFAKKHTGLDGIDPESSMWLEPNASRTVNHRKGEEGKGSWNLAYFQVPSFSSDWNVLSEILAFIDQKDLRRETKTLGNGNMVVSLWYRDNICIPIEGPVSAEPRLICEALIKMLDFID